MRVRIRILLVVTVAIALGRIALAPHVAVHGVAGSALGAGLPALPKSPTAGLPDLRDHAVDLCAGSGDPRTAWMEGTACVIPSSRAPAEEPWTPLVDDLLKAVGRRSKESETDTDRPERHQSHVPTGLCLVLGSGAGDLAAEIVRRSDFFVQVLETDDAQIELARRTLDATGLYGRRVAAERGSLARLPFPDYCANLIIWDLSALPQDTACCSELIRVLSPGGLAYVGQSAAGKGVGSHLPERPEGCFAQMRPDPFSGARSGAPISASDLRTTLTASGIRDFELVEMDGVWARIRRARPAGAGDWSHGRWGTPSNNPCVDDALVKAPFQTLWIAGPNTFTKFGLPLASAGRVLLRHGGITHEGRYTPAAQPDLIQAFDAYNGSLLWERRLEEREGEGFVAVDDRVFAAGVTTLYAFKAVDGSLVWKRLADQALDGMKSWGQYLCADGVLVAAVSDTPAQEAVGLRQRALVGLAPSNGSVRWMRQSETGIRSFALGEGLCFYSSPGSLAAVRILDGQKAWTQPTGGSGIVRYHRGKVYLDSMSFIAADGRPDRRGNFRGAFVGDRLYAGGLKGVTVSDLATGGTVPSFPVPRDPYCPKTGVPDGCLFMYGRCIMPTASTHCYFL